MYIKIIRPKIVTITNGITAYFNDGDLNLFKRINKRYFINSNKRFLDTKDYLIKEVIY